MAKKHNITTSKKAKDKVARQRASIITELMRMTEFLSKNDIANWRNAWQSAIDVNNPNRQKLYDIYRDAMVDAHLSGCIQQRVGFVMSR